jgi:hypothetical protein
MKNLFTKYRLLSVFASIALSSSAMAAPFSAYCNNGDFTISLGQYVAQAGGSGYIPVNININSQGVAGYFSNLGFTQSSFETSTAPALYNPNSSDAYSIYDSEQGFRWNFTREGDGVRVAVSANSGDPRGSANWYFQSCSFGQ